jgi:hypothetical protein
MSVSLFGREVGIVDLLESRRQDALDALSSRYAQGILDDTEFESALREVRTAPTETELSTVLRRYTPRSFDGSSGSPSQTVYAILSERRMTGNWITSRYVTSTTVMGEMTLDLRDVVLTEDTQLHVVAVMGEVKILVPPKMSVENHISAFLAEHNDTVGTRRGEGPTLRLTGTALLAEVSLR